MNEHFPIAAVGANVGLAGVHSLISNVSPVLAFSLLVLQVAVAGLTAWFLYKKVREVDRKEKFYKREKDEAVANAKLECPIKKKARRRKVARGTAAALLIFAVIFLFSGCAFTSAQVKPGRVVTDVATLTQSHSPKDSSTLNTETENSTSFVLPAGSTVVRDGATITISTNTPVVITNRTKVDSTVGAADMTIGKLIAKLQSVKWIQGVGIVVFLFGLASMFYPPLRIIVGSASTSLIATAAGLGLIVLPILLVGHEVLILGACGGAAIGYFFLHRYGKKSGEIAVLKRWVDSNGNGKVDPGEMV